MGWFEENECGDPFFWIDEDGNLCLEDPVYEDDRCVRGLRACEKLFLYNRMDMEERWGEAWDRSLDDGEWHAVDVFDFPGLLYPANRFRLVEDWREFMRSEGADWLGDEDDLPSEMANWPSHEQLTEFVARFGPMSALRWGKHVEWYCPDSARFIIY
ncbi:MAG: hypothetical protein LBQ12_06795 [Deltaproteobacteria bacterium]|jgi:hypothetical protein|nr:hypothetical protein [Deltaproteobacteria bacterium]